MPEEAYAPTRAFMEKHETLSFSLLVMPTVEPPLSFSTELVRSAGCVTGFTERLTEGVLGRALDCDRGGLGMYFAQGDGRHAVQGIVAVHAEQSLVRDSRVMLADARDALGLRRIRLDWRLGDIDYRTHGDRGARARRPLCRAGHRPDPAQRLAAAEPVALPGIGEGHRVGGHHHMCSTRMSRDPRGGVVDADCKVHGLANLYVGGSSVFATSGYANPTYTIVQLALRLGDHLAGLLRS